MNLGQNFIKGLLGLRVTSAWRNHYYSPIYSTFEWMPPIAGIARTHYAACFRCNHIPNQKHDGCGFHALFFLDQAKALTRNIESNSFLVLFEGLGDLALHELGFRAEQGRIVGILEWLPTYEFTALGGKANASSDLLSQSQAYFEVPRLEPAEAIRLIALQAHALDLRGFGLGSDNPAA